ncbi:CD3324 family protein [Dethiothermospora halolimnae]|uniref:CD3324 family protein n=1 Tax=Dethiothermospora halolimnae TaxID=3114390 RepID=UPI003CCC0C94
MKYISGNDIFPKELLKEIQAYAKGQLVYIPKPKESRKKWGENSGNRKYLDCRNEKIIEKFNKGTTINQLAEEFYLSVHSIKKIVYSNRCI